MVYETLHIPIKVDAFVVNKNVLNNREVHIRRNYFNYSVFEKYLQNPMPPAFNAGKPFRGTGVIVHWDLPEKLMNGEVDKNGQLKFPLVPNRWVICRISGPLTARKAHYWRINSDVIGNNDPKFGGADFLDPHGSVIKATKIGELKEANEAVPEEYTQEKHNFLTAMGPGNDLFATFQPYSENVFSLFDPLDHVDDQDLLTYIILGEYSHSQNDIVSSWIEKKLPFEEFLQNMNWKLPEKSSLEANKGAFSGSVNNVVWDLHGVAATSHIPNPDSVKIVLGETTADAMDTLQSYQSGDSEIYNALLPAWQRGLLHYYNDLDGAEALEKEKEDYHFTSYNGSYYWRIEDIPEENISFNEKNTHKNNNKVTPEWLPQLNRDQDQYDKESRNLEYLRKELYETWWKSKYIEANQIDPYPDGTSSGQFKQALDPKNNESLIYRVKLQMDTLISLQKKIPFGKTEEELEISILAFAREKGLDAKQQLKRHSRSLFRAVSEPVMFFHGLNNKEPLSIDRPLQVRFKEHHLQSFSFDGKNIKISDVLTLVKDLQPLFALEEYILLDPSMATAIAKEVYKNSDPAFIKRLETAISERKDYKGHVPEYTTPGWSQPWRPVMAQWHIAWYPFFKGKNGKSVWKFDGKNFYWEGEKPDQKIYPKEFKTTSNLLPLSGFTFRSRVKQMMEHNPNKDEVQLLTDFYNSLSSADDLLTASMSGLTDFFTQRTHGPGLSHAYDTKQYFPGYTLSALLGDQVNSTPDGGIMYNSKDSVFLPYRAGQFYIRRLHIIDTFGQVCELITQDRPMDHQIILSPGLKPEMPVFDKGYTFCQLQPRMLQPCRLDIHQISCKDDHAIVEQTHLANPVCGFLLHNFLDENIACYHHSGALLGNLHITTSPEVVWAAAPGSPYKTVDDIVKVPELEHMGLLLKGILRRGVSAYKLLLESIDKGNTMADGDQPMPDSKFPYISGLPIALVRVKLQLELYGTNIKDPSWKYTFKKAQNHLEGITFPARIGSKEKANDALFGYFLEKDYDTFYTDAVLDTVSEYIKPIGNGDSVSLPLDNKNGVLVSLLMHPRLPVTIKTGILPAAEYQISEQFIGSVFENMEVSFSTGPVLPESLIEESGTGVKHYLKIPFSKIEQGNWMWQQWNKKNKAWEAFPIMNPGDQASIDNAPLIYREGYLHFYSKDVSDKE
ncbi:hypothetical protein [Chryseobacterium indologenes]|uniref:hypothetical protein n=1 Tax=Chryseobacterium indologenes TaxID=253 RepID=UPI000646833D|nr:hypothetical protein [Chryseobacterium indologenes]